MISRSIESISTKVSSGITPLRSNASFWVKGTIPWLKTEQLGTRNIYSTNEKITEAALTKTSIKINPPDTLSIAMYGEGKTRGNVSILRIPMTTNQACCNVVLDKSKADVDYVYYNLKNQYFNLRALSSGVRKNLNSGDIKNFSITLPANLTEQNKIGNILSTIDEKIELNNRINAELEGMAKLLYNYWFVQFDFPMTASQSAAIGHPEREGKPYKSSGGKMVYNKDLKREIPDGWKIKDLGELCSTTRGVTYGKNDVRTPVDIGTTPILRATNVSNGVLDINDLVYVSEGMASSAQLMSQFDILIVMSSGSKMHIGKNALYFFDFKTAYGAFCSKITADENNRFFVAIHLQSKGFKKYISNVCLGTNINNLTNGHITDHKLVVPEEQQLAKFENTVGGFFQQIALNQNQNQQLTELRDWLLPMLMNGQVTVA